MIKRKANNKKQSTNRVRNNLNSPLSQTAVSRRVPTTLKNEHLKTTACVDSYKIAIVATMSAGKSTLLNAMIGSDLMPASNEACTARVFQLDQHINDQKTYEMLQANGNWVTLTSQDLKALNQDACYSMLQLRGYIQGLAQCADRGVSLFDTPGPNNSMDKTHSEVTQNFLTDHNYDVVIYVMNATQFGVNDDRYLLNDLKKIVNKPQKAKIIFAINKADKLDAEKGENINSLIKEVTAYLNDIGFHQPNIIPISAKAAGLARKSKNNIALTRSEKNELTNYYQIVKSEKLFDFIDHATLPLEKKSHLNIKSIANYKQEDDQHIFDAIIAQSGVLHLETYLHQLMIKDSLTSTSSFK